MQTRRPATDSRMAPRTSSISGAVDGLVMPHHCSKAEQRIGTTLNLACGRACFRKTAWN